MKRFLSFTLAALMLLSILTACNGEDPTIQPDVAGESIEEGKEPVMDMKNLNLVVDGVSEYVIVRGENASPSEVTAASELQSYLKQISGAELPIVTDSAEPVVKEIVVGKTNREKDGAFDRTELGVRFCGCSGSKRLYRA